MSNEASLFRRIYNLPVLLSLVVGILFAGFSFSLSNLLQAVDFGFTPQFTQLSTNPFDPDALGQRFMVPLLGYLTGLSGPRYYLLSLLGTVLFFSSLYHWASRFYERKIDALLLCGIFACTPVVLFNNVIYGWADIFVYSFLLLALLNPRWPFVFVLLGVLSHELFLTFLPLIYLYHFRYHSEHLLEYKHLKRQGTALLAVLTLCMLVRGLIGLQGSKDMMGLPWNLLHEVQPLLHGKLADNVVVIGFLTSYEMSSVLLLIFVFFVYKNIKTNPKDIALLLAALLPSVILLVASDTTRLWSNTFFFIALFPKFLPTIRTKLLAFVAICNLLIPTYYITPDDPYGLPLDRHAKVAAVHSRMIKYVFFGLVDQPRYRPGMVSQRQGLEAPLEPHEKKPNARYWRLTKELRIHHSTQGRGKRNVLVLHGGPGAPFEQHIAALDGLPDYTFHYYHQRGSGLSSRPLQRLKSDNPYLSRMDLNQVLGLLAHIADVERIRRVLGEKKITLMGHSYGALLASLYAAEFPHRVRGLILLSPPGVLQDKPSNLAWYGKMKAQLPAAQRETYSALLQQWFSLPSLLSKSEAQLVSLHQKLWGYYQSAARSKAFVVPNRSQSTRLGGWVVQGIHTSLQLSHNYRPALGRIKTRVTVLHGNKDFATQHASQAYLSAFRKSKRTFVSFPNAGHFLWLDQPRRFRSVLKAQLDAISWSL